MPVTLAAAHIWIDLEAGKKKDRNLGHEINFPSYSLLPSKSHLLLGSTIPQNSTTQRGPAVETQGPVRDISQIDTHL